MQQKKKPYDKNIAIVQPHKHESHSEALDPVIRIVPDNSTSQKNKINMTIHMQTSNHTKLVLTHAHLWYTAMSPSKQTKTTFNQKTKAAFRKQNKANPGKNLHAKGQSALNYTFYKMKSLSNSVLINFRALYNQTYRYSTKMLSTKMTLYHYNPFTWLYIYFVWHTEVELRL